MVDSSANSRHSESPGEDGKRRRKAVRGKMRAWSPGSADDAESGADRSRSQRPKRAAKRRRASDDASRSEQPSAHSVEVKEKKTKRRKGKSKRGKVTDESRTACREDDAGSEASAKDRGSGSKKGSASRSSVSASKSCSACGRENDRSRCKEEGQRKGKKRRRRTSRRQSKSDASRGKDGDGASSQGDADRRKRRKRRKRRRPKGSRSRSGSVKKGSRRRSRGKRRRRRRRRGGRSRSRSRSSRSDGKQDTRPMVERVKGGVKLFVGRLPSEATQQMLKDAFAAFGEVLEVFLIESTNANKGARCAFVRLADVDCAESAIAAMHEQLVLVPERRDLGPIQVAFAKGEALRFGLGAHREQLTSKASIGVGGAHGPPESFRKDGGRTNGFVQNGRGKPRRRSSSSSSRSSSRSSKSSRSKSSAGKATDAAAAVVTKTTNSAVFQEVEDVSAPKFTDHPVAPSHQPRAPLPPLPQELPPSLPDTSPPKLPPPQAAYKLAPACEPDADVEEFLARHRISPTTSFQMFRLSKKRAEEVMSAVDKKLATSSGGGKAEDLLLAVLKKSGARVGLAKAGAWTSQQRLDVARSSAPVRPGSTSTQNTSVNVSLDGLLGPELEESLPCVVDVDSPAGSHANAPAADSGRTKVEDRSEPRKEEPGDGKDDVDDAAGRAEDDERLLVQAIATGAAVQVKNLDKSIVEEDVRQLFKRCALVQQATIQRDPQTGLSKGEAVLVVSSFVEAEKSIKELNFTKPWGRALIVERYRREGDPEFEPPARADTDSKARSASGSGARSIERRSKSGNRGKVESTKADEKSKRRNRSRSKSRGGRSASSAASSRWSRYTLPSRSGRRKRGKKSSRRDSRSSSDSRRSRSEREDAKSPPTKSGAAAAPTFPGGLPGMMANPWGMPMMGPSGYDGGGYLAYDADQAERELARAEKMAKREERRKRHLPWEDHPARVKSKRKDSESCGSGSSSQATRRRDTEPRRQPQSQQRQPQQQQQLLQHPQQAAYPAGSPWNGMRMPMPGVSAAGMPPGMPGCAMYPPQVFSMMSMGGGVGQSMAMGGMMQPPWMTPPAAQNAKDSGPQKHKKTPAGKKPSESASSSSDSSGDDSSSSSSSSAPEVKLKK